MKIPKLNGKKLDNISENKFVTIYKAIYSAIEFDNGEHSLNLSDANIDILASNSAYMVLTTK